MPVSNRAIIVGGGIGGLSAAIALRQLGVESAVFERERELGEIGAGLSLWTNALEAFKSLGLAEAVQALGAPIERSLFRSWRGRLLGEIPVAEIGKKFGGRSVCVHRADLQATLLKALGKGVVRLGAQAVGFEQNDAGVTVRFADGREEWGDFLVGADGIHSVIQQKIGGSMPRYVGYTCWRGVAPYAHPSFPRGVSFESWGRGLRFGALHISNRRVYWYATMNGPAGNHDRPGERRPRLLERFRGWHEPIAAMIEATAESAILQNDIIDREAITRWSLGRVTLLGDAAMKLTPAASFEGSSSGSGRTRCKRNVHSLRLNRGGRGVHSPP